MAAASAKEGPQSCVGGVARRHGAKPCQAQQGKELLGVRIDGKVYDFTDFLDQHPAGAEAILKYGGKDGIENFHAIHKAEMLEDFQAIATLG